MKILNYHYLFSYSVNKVHIGRWPVPAMPAGFDPKPLLRRPINKRKLHFGVFQYHAMILPHAVHTAAV